MTPSYLVRSFYHPLSSSEHDLEADGKGSSDSDTDIDEDISTGLASEEGLEQPMEMLPEKFPSYQHLSESLSDLVAEGSSSDDDIE